VEPVDKLKLIKAKIYIFTSVVFHLQQQLYLIQSSQNSSIMKRSQFQQ